MTINLSTLATASIAANSTSLYATANTTYASAAYPVFVAAGNSTQPVYVSGTTGTSLLSFVPSTGSLTAGGNITAYSDERLKQNIQTIENALELVKQMRGVRYERDIGPGVGVVAQEIQKVLPEVVFESDGEEHYLSVAYGNIIGVLIEAIKDLNEKIDNLSNK